MIIATWNVNSIRARIENIKKYLKVSAPDIVLLQEIKTEECNYPFSDIKELGYTSYVNGQKSYNGVAILSRKKLNNINRNLPGDKIKQSRFISTEIEWVPLNSVEITKNHLEIATEFLETLDNDDDVQNIYTNLKIRNN